MNDILRTLILTCILVFTGQVFMPRAVAAQEEPLDMNAMGRQSLASTVLIYTRVPGRESHFQASGFFVNEAGNVITNHHVVEGAARIAVQTLDGTIYQVKKILAVDITSDLALLEVDMRGQAVVPLPLNTALPEREARVAVVGNPAGAHGVVSTGRIFSVLQMPGYGPLLQITAPIANGSSGSPVLNDKKEVIGVATFQLTSTENFNFAIPAARVSALLAERQEAALELADQNAVVRPASDFERGKSALQANDYGQALSLFQALLGKEESAEQSAWRGWEIWFYLGRSYGGLGRHGAAVSAFQKAAELMPELAVIHYNLGVAYTQVGAYDLATASFQRATGLYPDMAEAHFNLGMICLMQQNARCIRDTLDILRRVNPDLAGLFLRRLHGER